MAAGLLGGAMLFLAFYLAIPRADIEPGDGASGIKMDQALRIDASPLARIAKIAVYADGELIDIEYNLETGQLDRELRLKAGQTIRVEAKVASPIGLTREVTATFATVEPLLVAEVTVDGQRLDPGSRMPPMGELTFHFNKPVTRGSVTVDDGETFELWIDEHDPRIAVLKSFFPLAQGATHSFKLAAAASDEATVDQELLIDVVRPLSLYGQVESAGGELTLALYGSVPFRDPASIRGIIESDLPAADIRVEDQKIIITCQEPDPNSSYFIRLASAAGIDGSALANPLQLNLDMRGAQTQLISSTQTAATGYSGSANAGSRSDSGSAVGSGPPPGWPPCCPWPPQ